VGAQNMAGRGAWSTDRLSLCALEGWRGFLGGGGEVVRKVELAAGSGGGVLLLLLRPRLLVVRRYTLALPRLLEAAIGLIGLPLRTGRVAHGRTLLFSPSWVMDFTDEIAKIVPGWVWRMFAILVR
jgi:hypothetical protein